MNYYLQFQPAALSASIDVLKEALLGKSLLQYSIEARPL